LTCALARSRNLAPLPKNSGSVYPTPTPQMSTRDVFQQAQFSQSDSSDASTQFGAQEIDLCDPLVTGDGDFPLC
jgi:hypothetical protein